MRRVGLLLVAFSVGLLIAGVGIVAAGGSSSTQMAITPSPAYTAAQLNAPAGQQLADPHGQPRRARYSSLTQITKSNVGHAQGGLAHQPRHVSDEGRVVRLARGQRGRRRRHVLHPDAEERRLRARRDDGRDPLEVHADVVDPGFNVGSGGRSPGVAIGEGKVYIGTRDGYVIALDQMTGGQVWKTEVLPWRKGGNVSAAPIYVNGIVLIGDSTGDNGGQRLELHAYDADNGRGSGRGPSSRSRASPAATRGRRPTAPLRRRLDVGVAHRRHEARPRDLRDGQPEAVELARPGHEPLHGLDRGAEPLHGPARVGLPDRAPRPLGLGPAEQRRSRSTRSSRSRSR